MPMTQWRDIMIQNTVMKLLTENFWWQCRNISAKIDKEILVEVLFLETSLEILLIIN